jgi:hypothetical protein
MAASGAPEDFVRADLDDLRRAGFDWIRVWATWNAFEKDSLRGGFKRCGRVLHFSQSSSG